MTHKHFHELRFLLHGSLEHYESNITLYVTSEGNPVWSKVAKLVLDNWRIIPNNLATIIPPNQYQDLNINSISPQTLIQDLDPSKFNTQNFSPKECQEILSQVSIYGTKELWRSLPLHTALNGETVSITDNTYRSNPKFSVPLKLEHCVVLIEQTNRPDWIQLWEPKAAIETILKLSHPSQYCGLLLDLISQIPDLDRSENTLLGNLKKIPWLQLETQETVEPNRVVLLPELLTPFKNELKEVFVRENGCPYVSPIILQKNIQAHKSLKTVCLTWTYTDVFRFLLKETQKPSNHVVLLLGILTTLENKQQTPSNQIPPLLAQTKWLVDSEGQPRSPEQVIDLKTLEDTVTKILSESKPQQYISPSMLRKDINLSRNLISKWFKFISGEDAFEKLGEILANQPRYYLGDLSNPGMTRDLANELSAVLKDCEQTFILKLASQDLDAFEVFIFEQVLKPIHDNNRIIKVLNHIIENNSKPNKTAIKIFNLYLKMICELDKFKSSILPNIKLLDQHQKWKSPGSLCDGSSHYNIDLEYLLDSEQRNIIASHLNKLASNSSVSRTLSAPNPNIINTENYTGDDSKKLEEYFKPWLQYAPSQAIGGIIALLAGRNERILQLAQSFLQRRPVEDLRRDLLFGEQLRSRTFSIQINEGTTQSVQSILGEIFEAPVSDFQNVETIFLGTIDSSISLRKIDLQQLDKETVIKLLFQSFKQLMRSLDPHGYVTKEEIIKNIWHRLNISEQIEVEVAKDFILSNSKYLLRILGIRNSQISQQLKLWDDKVFALSDWRSKSHKNPGDFEKLTKEIADISDSIGNLIQSEVEIQVEILKSVRKTIGEGQYGYHESNIPFEIFQNADDAVQELETFYSSIELERQYFVLEYSYNKLIFMHWGRPINKFCSPDDQDQKLRERGFDRDLVKMLSFNISDKEKDQTGKFGLGFKTVHLVTASPHVLSGDLSFKVCGGILPLPITDLDIQEDLREQLNNQRLSSTLTDGTIISLPLQADSQDGEIIRDFEKQANLLLVFAKAIRRCKLITHSYTKELRWSPKTVFDIPGIEVGKIYLLNVSSEWKKHRLLNFRLDSGCIALVLTPDLGTNYSPLQELPTFWVTAPIKEGTGLRFIINSNFDITTGRSKLDPNSSKNQELIKALGRELAEKLDLLFQASRGDNWSSLERILDIGSLERYKFWSFLWNVLAKDWLDKSSDSRANDLIGSGLSGVSQGLAHVINTRPALPNELSNDLVCVQEIQYQVCGVLAKTDTFPIVSSWNSFQQHYPDTSLVNHAVWKRVKKLWGSDSLPNISKLYLADCLQQELGNRCIDATTANRIGHVVNPENMKAWESGEKSDYEKITDVLQSSLISFINQAGNPLSASLLLLRQPEDQEEKRLVAFAPPNRILCSGYIGSALQFFRVCRQRRETVNVEELVKWSKDAQIEQQKQGVRQYLLSGEQSSKFAECLRGQISGTWMRNDPGIESLLQTKDFQKNQNLALQGKISWNEVKFATSTSTATATLPPSPQLLSKIYDWWQENCDQEITKYNEELYPVSVEEFKASLQNRDRSAWLMLFFIGATHTMGRTQYEQHRNFIQFCTEEKNWWKIFASPSPETKPQEWMQVLNEYIDPQVDQIKWFYWMEKFTSLYQISKYLDEYRDSFLSIEKRRQNFNLQDLLKTRASFAFSGGGIDAPPQRIGIGANFVIRELVRLGIVKLNDSNRDVIIPHCFLPKGKVRRVLRYLGCQNLEKADCQVSKKIFAFIQTKRNKDIADMTFKKSFDIPFQLYPTEKLPGFDSMDIQFDYE